MKDRSPAFQFYPADFIADENVELMDNRETGCYIRLLSRAWIEGSIPADITKIARLCREGASDMAQLWLAISPCFVEAEGKPGRLVNRRQEEIRKEQALYRQERAASGAKGAKARWDRRSVASDDNGLANGSAIPQPIANDGPSSLSSSSSSMIDHHEEKGSPPEPVNPPEPTPLQEVEHYLMGRMQAMSLGGTDYTAVMDWLQETGGNVEVICKAIDAGLMVHQKDKPGTVPRSARFYSGYVEKQWSRYQAEVNSSGRAATGSAGATSGETPGAGPRRAGPNTRGGERQGGTDEGFGFNSLTHRGGTGEPDMP